MPVAGDEIYIFKPPSGSVLALAARGGRRLADLHRRKFLLRRNVRDERVLLRIVTHDAEVNWFEIKGKEGEGGGGRREKRASYSADRGSSLDEVLIA